MTITEERGDSSKCLVHTPLRPRLSIKDGAVTAALSLFQAQSAPYVHVLL